MNNEELKPYLRLKYVFRELTVYRAFAQVAKLRGFTSAVEGEGVLDVDKLLESARRSPALEEWVDSHFLEFEKSLALTDESLFDRALRELLEGWNPTGKPNGQVN
jgi:hypothetical protein